MHHVLPVIAYRRTQAFVGDAHKLTIFDQLTPTEYVEVLDYLYAHPTLDLTCKYSAYFFMNATEGMPCKMPYTAATWNRANWLTKLELDPPNKAQTLAYLAGTGPRPARYAKFHFMRGARTPRDSVMMKVGPLPISTLTTVTQMTELTTDNQIPWPARPYDGGEEFFIYKPALNKALEIIAPLVNNLTAQVATPGSAFQPQIVEWTYPDHTAMPANINGNGPNMRRVMNGHYWIQVTPHDSPSAGGVIKPFPLHFSYVMDYTVLPSEWPLYNWVYCNQGPYASPQALLAAWNSGAITPCTMEATYYKSTLNTMKPVPMPQVPGGAATMRPSPGDASLIYTPGGQRMAVAGKAVQWMGWQFHVDVNPVKGLNFFDIRFKNERIVYEMTATDFGASYFSARSLHNMHYSDGGYMQGSYTSPLVKDVDCPKHAIYIDAGLTGPEWGGDIVPLPRGICIFEAPENVPLFRHFSPSYSAEMDQYRGLPSTVLVARSIISIGNYDYVQHATFFLDGKMKYEKSASGYSLGIWDELDEAPRFGQHFTHSVTGSMHLHQGSFKVDIDIGANPAANALQLMKLKWGTYEEATGRPKPGWIVGNGVLYANKTIATTESKYWKKDYNMYDIVSTTETNQWGEKRGYEIDMMPGEPAYQPEGHPLLHTLNYTKYNLAVVKRKESEPQESSQNYVTVMPTKAPSDIGTMLNGENIESEDIVAYISMSKLHYPKAEDVPMPSIFTGGFMLKPHNYFNRAAYSDLPNTMGTTTECTMTPS